MRLALLLLVACAHVPRASGIPYGDVYCARACRPGAASQAFLATLERAEMAVTLADCCKEAR